jgi:hypothetical protein
VIRFAGLFAIWQSACIRPKQSSRPRDRKARAPKVLVPELVPELSWLDSAVCRSHRHDQTDRANDDADGLGRSPSSSGPLLRERTKVDSMQPARKVASVVDAFEALRSAAIRDSKYDLQGRQGRRRCCSVIEGPTRNRISATGAREFAEDQPCQIARKVLRQIIRKVTHGNEFHMSPLLYHIRKLYGIVGDPIMEQIPKAEFSIVTRNFCQGLAPGADCFCRPRSH